MCGIPLQTEQTAYCDACLHQPKPFQRSYIAAHYQFPTNRLIQQLKFQHHFNHLPVLTQLLIDRVEQTADPLPDILIPVPLHPSRMRQRGFNQSIELGKRLAQHFQRPLLKNAIQRAVNTPAQTGLSGKLRRQNVRQAFQLTQPIQAQHVAIIDDVVTTTSTVAALASVLSDAGVPRIDIWAIARASKR